MVDHLSRGSSGSQPTQYSERAYKGYSLLKYRI